MNNNIKYYIKHVYGNQNMYIADKTQAQAIQNLTNQKTLTTSTMRALEVLGFTFEQVLTPNNI
jgi:hypothetical protein